MSDEKHSVSDEKHSVSDKKHSVSDEQHQMNSIEATYRRLLRAYPADHRARYESEMVSVLLDVAADEDRTRPRFREATAIVFDGLSARLGAKSELHHGLRLAGVGALAITLGIAAMALTLSAQQPLDDGAIPAISWLIVAGVALYGSASVGRYRVVPAATAAVLMVGMGSTLMGYRRTVLVVAALMLIIGAFAPYASRTARVGGAIAGLALGTAFGLLNINDMQNLHPPESTPWAWVPSVQWQSTADTASILLYRLAILLALAGLVAAFKRARFAVASLALSAPTLAISLVAPGRFHILQTSTQVVIGTALSLVALGLASIVPWGQNRFDSQGPLDRQGRF